MDKFKTEDRRNILMERVYTSKSVFISYCHKDEKWAADFFRMLYIHEFVVWKDNVYINYQLKDIQSGIRPSKKFPKVIADQIDGCDIFVALISDAYLNSEWCKRELTYAPEHNKTCIKMIVRRDGEIEIPNWAELQYENTQTIEWKRNNTDVFWELFFQSIGSAFMNDVEDEVVRQINEKLFRKKENHKSILLLNQGVDGVDDGLFPKGESNSLIKNDHRNVMVDNTEILSLKDFVEKSWSENKQVHLFITGKGGIGKTVALLCFSTEEGFLPKNVPTIYIPLYDLAIFADKGKRCIDEYLIDEYNDEQYQRIIDLSKKPWNNGPNVILLLDGYNEIPDEKRERVKAGILRWAIDRQGTQIVTTSRIDAFLGVANMRTLALLELPRQEAKRYLLSRNVPLPEESSKIWKVITTPLMLNIYAGTMGLSKLDEQYLRIKDAISAGSLIWNYNERELYKCLSLEIDTEVNCAAAILLIAPYVCWKMEKNDKFSLSEREYIDYIQEACDFWWSRRLPNTFIERKPKWFKNSLVEQGREAFIASQRNILYRQAGLFCKIDQGTKYALMHQNFRDGLSAIHFYNECLVNNGNVPDSFFSPINVFVKEFLADIADEKTIVELWNANKLKMNTIAVNNLMGIFWHMKNGSLATLNWSGMDLRGISLYEFRNTDGKLKLSKNPEFFNNTIFDINCFKPSDQVEAIAYSYDERYVAAGYRSGTIMLWSTETYQKIGGPLNGLFPWAKALAFNMNSTILASGFRDGTIQFWNVKTRNQISEPITPHSSGITTLVFNKDSSMVVVGYEDGAIGVCNIQSDSHIWEVIDGHSMCVSSLATSLDGNFFASGSHDGTVRIWNLRKVLPYKEFRYSSSISCVAFSGDSLYLSSGLVDGSVYCQKLASTDCEDSSWMIQFKSPIVSIACDIKAFRISGITKDATIFEWIPSAEIRTSMLDEYSRRNVQKAVFGKSLQTVVSAMGDQTIRMHNMETGNQIGSVISGGETFLKAIAYSSNGMYMAAGLGDGTILLWNAYTRELALEPWKGHDDWVRDLAFSKDGRYLVSGSRDGTIRIWNIETRWQVCKPINCGNWVEAVALSPNGKYVAGGTDDGLLRVWEVETGRQVGNAMKHDAHLRAICYGSDAIVYSGSGDGKVRIWNVETQQLIRSLECDSWVESIAMSPKGRFLASGSNDGIRIWDLKRLGKCRKLDNHLGWIGAVCFSKTGDLLVSGSNDCTLIIWNTHTGKPNGVPLSEHNGEVRGVAVHPEGMIASASYDGTIRIWDLETHECIDMIYILQGIHLYGLNFNKAILDDELRKTLIHNGVTVNINI